MRGSLAATLAPVKRAPPVVKTSRLHGLAGCSRLPFRAGTQVRSVRGVAAYSLRL